MNSRDKRDPLYQNIADEFNLGELLEIELIQNLWSGYGELVRLKFQYKTIILKHVKLPKDLNHPRGWNSEFSHQRKLHSFEVEVNWYGEFSIKKDERCPVPLGLKCFKSENEYLMVMEDLAESGFGFTTMSPTMKHLKSSLVWLANFHAKYMEKKTTSLWKIGTYWHLDTRPEELENLADKSLKLFAKEIDRELNQVKYKTFVHGDAKLANFCFNQDGSKCAAVDFQYVGHGCGMKDLVYFISSAVDPRDCKSLESWLLDTYFNELKRALEYYNPKIDIQELEQEWRAMFVIAWADFQRFIKGWSPNHYKINSYSEDLKNRALAYLQSKSNRV